MKTHIELAQSQLFPNGAYITWGIGHLVELKEPKAYDPRWTKWTLASLPILPERYEFQVAKGKYAQFQACKKAHYRRRISLLMRVTWTAKDRISSIVFTIKQVRKEQTIKRLWINSLEVDEVRKGFANLHDNRKDLLMYEEAKARQISDWLVGMNGSRLYSLLLKARGIQEVFPIGRVQSPTVYLIYQRQREIETFVSEPFFEIEATFTAGQWIV